jgi:uncharacterized UPF0160 family protein
MAVARQKVVAVHNQTFHADDSLSVYLLWQTSDFKDARVVRTRNAAELAECDAVCDTGGVYDHEQHRYDHHQPSFDVKFPKSQVPLSSCGQIYLNYGEEIIRNILAKNGRAAGEHTRFLWRRLYFEYLQEVDASDNGFPQYPEATNRRQPNYSIRTGISERIAHMNPPDLSQQDAVFFQAVDLIGNEFKDRLLLIFDSEVPAAEIARDAVRGRFDVHGSGQVIVLAEPCPDHPLIQRHIKRWEKREKSAPIWFYIQPQKGVWHVHAITDPSDFRRELPCRGLQGAELVERTGIQGALAVHWTGESASFGSKEAAIEFAAMAVTA